jgi:hypothetical protein
MIFLNVATATFVYANSSLDSFTICGSTEFKATPPAARDARGGLSSNKERRKVLPRESRKSLFSKAYSCPNRFSNSAWIAVTVVMTTRLVRPRFRKGFRGKGDPIENVEAKRPAN